jgi:hypothetical protein
MRKLLSELRDPPFPVLWGEHTARHHLGREALFEHAAHAESCVVFRDQRERSFRIPILQSLVCASDKGGFVR